MACRFPVPVPAIHSRPIQCFNWRNFSEKRSDRHMYSGTVTSFRRNAVQLQHTIDNSIRFTYAMFFCSLSISPPTIHEHTRRQNILFRYPGFYRSSVSFRFTVFLSAALDDLFWNKLRRSFALAFVARDVHSNNSDEIYNRCRRTTHRDALFLSTAFRKYVRLCWSRENNRSALRSGGNRKERDEENRMHFSV